MEMMRKTYQVLSYRLTKRPYPEEVVLELTTRCNSLCSYCPRPTLVKDGKLMVQDMDSQTFKDLILMFSSRCPQLEYIVFSGLGEPTLHPRFSELLEFAKSHFPEAKLWLITNGTTLKRHMKTIVENVDVVQISLNVWGRENYRKVNGTDSFPVVVCNTLKLLQRFPRRCRVHVQLLIANFNKDKYSTFQKTFKPHLRNSDKLVFEEMFNNVGFTDLTKFQDKPRQKTRNPCYHLFTSFNIMVDGECYPCCGGAMARFLPNQGGLRLGNIKSSSDDLFQHQKLKTLQQSHLNDKAYLIPACARCDVWMNSRNPFIKIGGKWH